MWLFLLLKNEKECKGLGDQYAIRIFGLVWFYGISTFVGYLTPNQFYLKQFSLAWVHSLIIKNISISK